MNRRDFVALMGVLGLGGLTACGGEPDVTGSFDGDVLVIGAGAAGMSAAHFLERAGVNVTVLEAGPAHGGRIKTVRDFVDFPIPLGGEWLHTDATELDALVDRTDHGITMAAYKATDETGYWSDGEYTVVTEDPDSDLKFVGRTWLDVFDEFIVPSIADRMRFGVVVETVDHSGDRIVVTAADGSTHEADRLIVTAPIVALRDQMAFTPDLPEEMRTTLDEADVWGGFKAFVEFTEQFYPTSLVLDGRNTDDGQHLYYDASYGQASDRRVLGLFTVGTGSDPYREAQAEGRLIELILSELDPIFDGRPSATYVQHIHQDWNAEPHIHMAYLADNADWQTPRRLSNPIDDRIFFAGSSYIKTIEGWSMVHLAARAGREAVDQILS